MDPYYLAQKAQEVGYHPEIILSGRRLNDSMGSYVADQVIKLMVKKDIPVRRANILILGFTFKENCPDVRNTRVIDIVNELLSYKTQVDVFDPHADVSEVEQEYRLSVSNVLPEKAYDAVVLAVSHKEFLALDFKKFTNAPSVIYDVKGVLSVDVIDGRL